MKVLIIEDEAPAARRIKKLLSEIDTRIEVLDVIDSIEASVKWLKAHHNPELIFMDIQLADGQSFDIFQQVEIKSPVIFTTAYDDYALKAFKVNSIDYLLKPIDPDELKSSIDKFNSLKDQYSKVDIDIRQILQELEKSKKVIKPRFLIRMGDRLISIETNDIAFFYTENKVSYLYTKTGKKYLLDQNLDELESTVDGQYFFRLNRQFIAHISSIESIHNYFNGKLKIFLKPHVSEEIIVSREKAGPFKKWLGA